ncbi:hypothetical protein ABIE41_003340 [Bosea sp. OAE506]|uniref:hypothetical protein n=1 Tax=Bosea sp. OAE506 TaxID=2663870 RepID=UPI00178BBA4F
MADDAVTILLGAEEREALDAYRRDLGPSASRADALAAILREWMSRPGDTAGGEAPTDQGLRPSELNSSNDI